MAAKREIDGSRNGSVFQVDLGGEGALLLGMLHKSGCWIDERGCADGQEDVAGRGRDRGVDVLSSQRFAEPDDGGRARRPQ